VPEGRQDRPDSGEAEKKTTLSSRESELRYRRLFETAQDGILIIDFDSERIIDANLFLTQLLGYPHDELVGKTLWEIGPFSDVVRSKIAFDELKTKGSIRYEDLPLETRDGRQCKVEFVSNVYALDGAKVIQCNIRDITERKQAEEAMRRQADLLQKTFDSMTAAVFILDARLPTPTVVECNQAACAVFGYGREEMLGKTTEFLHVSDETLREFRALLYSAVEEGRLPFHLAEFHMKRKNGTIFPSEHTVSQLTNIKGERTAWVSIVRDITEHKRAEEALRESEARYRTLFDSTNDAIFIHDMGRRFLEFNKVFCELLGYSREELLQMTPADVSSPEYASQVVPRLAELRQVGHAFFESAYVRRDGTIIPIELSTRIIEFKGKPTVLSIARDVTERKRMETALKESEERYRMMFRSMGDAVAVYEAMDQGNDFVFRDFNEAAERIEKIKSEDVIGRSILEVFPGVKDLGLFEVFQRVWKTGKPEHLPAGIYKDRRIVGWRENYVYKLPSGELVAVYQDVTDRKRLEEELRQYSLHLESLVNERTKELRSARERLEYVIGSNPAVIYTGKPLADGSDFVLTYISERVSAMLGFEPSDFIGHPEFWERHVHPEDLRPTLVQIPRLWKEGQHAFEYRFLHKDGTYRWIREEGKVGRDTDGKPIEVNGYWTDVSERKRLEEELVKSQRLATIGETSAMVGHDLRNPLQGIAGIVYLAKRDLESRKAADRKAAAALLDTIQEQIVYMDKIVSDLQDYSQPLAPKLTETNLPNLIRQTLSTINIPEAVKVTVEIEKPAENAMIDPTLMRRTLTNLTINAIQAMPKKGKLTIRARSKRDSTIMTVEDTGAGIPRKNLGKLFSPFFTTKAKGQGLGLAVCKRLVEAQGGTITVKSKPRKGTAFTIKLPRGRKEVAS